MGLFSVHTVDECLTGAIVKLSITKSVLFLSDHCACEVCRADELIHPIEAATLIAAVKTLLGVFQPRVEKLPLEIRGEHF